MSRADLTRRVFLIGFMGAGKTTVGRALARRLGWNFFDLDDVIEQREGRSVATIFAHAGEAVFRRAESDALRWLLQERDTSSDLILALGGGAFVQPENRAMIERAQGTTILLEAPLEELRRRCQTDATGRIRPLAQHEDQFAQLFEARREAYEKAQRRISTKSRTVEQVTETIAEILLAAKPEVKQ